MIELLSPVGDFDCLKAAVQSGADAVYFGGTALNARNYAGNFDEEGLKKAIRYAKLRNVKVNFTLNILVKDSEFLDAVHLALYVHSLGADALIIQDLGLAKYLIDNYPDINVHASTQMSIHNLDGVLELENLGFKRVVLARELSIREIEYICNNSSIEVETFVHGALCISYSGQCLLSSSIGGRSGNRGKCAQPCRLKYELIEESSNFKNSNIIDKGYLLSPRDLCGLNYIPDLIRAGVKSLKIEGRMKSPTYVATVTRIYRKYIDLAYSNEPYIVDDKDVQELMQAFNRGGFSEGNFSGEPNNNYIYKEKPNNMGLYCGNVSHVDSSKGLISFQTTQSLEIGDKVSLENEDGKYTISELMINKKNIKNAMSGSRITIGRIKGNITPGDKIYKLSSTAVDKKVSALIQKENVKIPIAGFIKIKKNQPVVFEVTSCDNEEGNYFSMSSVMSSDMYPVEAINAPLTAERVKEQLNKTTDTPFEFKYINIDMDDNLYLPKISVLNQLRRNCIEDLMKQAIKRFENKVDIDQPLVEQSLQNQAQILAQAQVQTQSDLQSHNQTQGQDNSGAITSAPAISLFLTTIDNKEDYSKLENVKNAYIPFKYFLNKEYYKSIHQISQKAKLYVHMPIIIKDNYKNVILNHLDNIIEEFNIYGIVIANISSIHYLQNYIHRLKIVANLNFNVFNKYSISELKKLGISRITLSPELDKNTLQELSKESELPVEILVYGKLPVMNIGYCLLGSSNKCYPTCETLCRNNSRFFLKDRLGFKFRVIPDNLQTVTTLYNSKITSIKYSDIEVDYVRISIIDRSVKQINEIISRVKDDNPFSGTEYTKGNLEKTV